MEKEVVKDIARMDEDFSKWYTDIVTKAGLVDYSPVKGFMVIKPYGYEIWENIQKELDKKFKETGHKNAYFPLLIPESMLNIEKEHVEGFAPEVAWVTHGGEEKLEERLCIRPTSETIIATMYAKWVKSYRDLPVLINQWANVVRWEKTTRPFLRTTEFLWQEGHTLHETSEEAMDETIKMLNIYAELFEEFLAIPVIKGEKSNKEKFAGAENTFTIEALMHDGKALQSATSHYFGDRFAKAYNIKYQGRDSKEATPFQTSWGMSTRSIGGIIMTHGDERGLKLPPKVAPIQVIIVPFAQHKEGVLEEVDKLRITLKNKFRIEADIRDSYTPGYKCNDSELKGIPVRIEIGPKDIEKGECILFRRDTYEKKSVSLDNLENEIERLLEDIQKNMFEMAKENRTNKTHVAKSLDEIKEILSKEQSLIKTAWCGDRECEDRLKEETSATIRCIPFDEEKIADTCGLCSKTANNTVYLAKQY
ncbi:MAG: proline--tRNA ligase [Clostridia bacterium]|nr:proline--tRNA ligase [Clostridia bacterium]